MPEGLGRKISLGMERYLLDLAMKLLVKLREDYAPRKLNAEELGRLKLYEGAIQRLEILSIDGSNVILGDEAADDDALPSADRKPER